MKLKKIIKITLIYTCLFNVACHQNKNNLLLPVYGEKKLNGNDTIYHQIANFSLINQHGKIIDQNSVKDKIYIANFFFTTCQSICPVMSTNLKYFQKEFEKDDSVLILSHTVNPLHDTIEILKNYAITYGAINNKWHLLTGNKKQIYDLAKTSYLVNALEDDGTTEGFIHSEMFLLIDTKSRIRGVYDGTDKAQVLKLISDVKLLKQELK